MLYTTLSKAIPESKYKVPKAAQTDAFISELNNAMGKNAAISISRMMKHKNGRNTVQKELRQYINKSSNNPYPSQVINFRAAEQREQGNCRPNLTVYEHYRPKNVKRHTYNYQFCSSDREDEVESDALNSRDLPMRNKKSCISSNPTATPNVVKRSFIQRRVIKNHHEDIHKDEQIDENQAEFLQPKINAHMRKISIHNKLTPIDFNESISYKPSLVDLIKKFKFQNLKTNNINSESSHSIEEKKKYAESNFVKTQTKQKTHPFFKQQRNSFYGNHFHQRRFNRKVSKDIRKSRQESEMRNTHFSGIKKSNSILSPWGTITDQFFINQTPID